MPGCETRSSPWDTTKVYPDGVTFWDKQEDIHKSAHAGGQDVHSGPGLLPWHRELVNRLEALLRKVDPELSLHYWDWTTDPTTAGGVNLFTTDFMGQAHGDAGLPFQNFESTEGGAHKVIWRDLSPGAPPVAARRGCGDQRRHRAGIRPVSADERRAAGRA